MTKSRATRGLEVVTVDAVDNSELQELPRDAAASALLSVCFPEDLGLVYHGVAAFASSRNFGRWIVGQIELDEVELESDTE